MTTTATREILISGATKEFPDSAGGVHRVLDGIDLEVHRGEFVCMVGRSGCGKTTLLNLIGGFELADGGSVEVGGRPVTGPGADRMVVFQDYALFPWLSTVENVEFVLRVQGVSRAERRRRALDALDLVGLRAARDRAVHKLSGGMKQRVAIARALVAEPRVLLMDEPFAALDTQQRVDMQKELMRICEATGQTVVFVTHSLEEAIFLADRIVVMVSGPGRIAVRETVPLDRPRDRTSEEFNEIKRRLGTVLEAEAKREAEDERARLGAPAPEPRRWWKR